jgi:cell division protein FtsL
MKQKQFKKNSGKNDGRKTTRVWLIVMSLFLSELFFYTWCRVQFTRVGYDISEGTKEQQHLLALQRNLDIEVARLKSPERIETIARQQLGLITPTPKQVIIIP